MHAYDFILILFSFVYAAAVTHLLSSAGEIIIASNRVVFSWLNAGWMLAGLAFTCAWWIGLWDLHAIRVWDVGSVVFYFLIASGMYLYTRLVCPPIDKKGENDLRAFHASEGRKYLIAYALMSWVTVAVNALPNGAAGAAQWPAQNLVIAPMALAASAAAVFIKQTWLQFVALAIQLLGLVWYFVALQSALVG